MAQVVTLAAETGLAARIAARTRPHRLMLSPLDWVSFLVINVGGFLVMASGYAKRTVKGAR